MKALDTNILIRFLINDDIKQAERVKELLKHAEEAGDAFYVSEFVVIEMVWVLSALYELSRGNILDAIEELMLLSVLNFFDNDFMVEFIAISRNSNLDLSDILIGLSGKTNKCPSTITFDKKAAKSESFELIKT